MSYIFHERLVFGTPSLHINGRFHLEAPQDNRLCSIGAFLCRVFARVDKKLGSRCGEKEKGTVIEKRDFVEVQVTVH